MAEGFGFRALPFREAQTFDGKRMRKAIVRRVVDGTAPIVTHCNERLFQRDERDRPAIFGHPAYTRNMLPVSEYSNVSACVCTKFIHTSTNKKKSPVNVVSWTPEGRRLITGTTNGEFTLWNGMAFNFETILQAHEDAIRAMEWSHSGKWMVSADSSGLIKYWQSNMNNVKAYRGHTEAVRGVSFSPSDLKLVTASDDSSLKIFDFARCEEERELKGHGWDVRCVSWHPLQALVASGSKDNLIKLWDPKDGKNVATLHGHRNRVLRVCWNMNGYWLLTCSGDQLIKCFDIRTMREIKTFRGHKKEVTALTWHPHNEILFSSGSFDGAILHWSMDEPEPIGSQEGAHDSAVFDLQYHPLGHVLCSGSNDHSTRFWCRPRPGDGTADDFSALQVWQKRLEQMEEQERKEKAESDGRNPFSPVK